MQGVWRDRHLRARAERTRCKECGTALLRRTEQKQLTLGRQDGKVVAFKTGKFTVEYTDGSTEYVTMAKLKKMLPQELSMPTAKPAAMLLAGGGSGGQRE